MSKTVEYRVRPVVRYVITRYERDSETGSGAIETLGEFPNEGYAERTCSALKVADPYSGELPPLPAPDHEMPQS